MRIQIAFGMVIILGLTAIVGFARKSHNLDGPGVMRSLIEIFFLGFITDTIWRALP